MNDTQQFLQILAKKHNIDAIGVVNSSALDKFAPFFESLEKNAVAFYKRDYSYKTDIKKAWDKTVSVISFAVSYNTPVASEPPEMEKRGKIARAGLGNDYHTVLKNRAGALMRELTTIYPCEYRIYVDTGFLSDRALAYCAGLGYYGKNNFLIVPTLGSFVYLGHILCDIRLEENETLLESECKNCRACIEACPKKANGGRVLKYVSCISYITQSDLCADTAGYIYGCDICQNVCPVNKKAAVKSDPDFTAESEKTCPLLCDIVTEGKERFEEDYAASALLWAGYGKIRKNALNILSSRENSSNGFQ